MTIWQSDQDLEDIRRFNSDFGVVSVKAAIFRECGATIVRVPLVGNLNHCEIFPRFKQSAQKKIRNSLEWVFYPSWVLPEHQEELALQQAG